MLHVSLKSHPNSLFIKHLYKKTPFILFLFLIEILINLFFNSFVFCQSQTTSTNDSLQINAFNSLDSTLLPKKIQSNFSIGFRGGITNGQFEITNPEENDKNAPSLGSVLTIFTNYRINSHFSIQPEFGFGRYRSNNTLYRIALLQGTVDYSISTFDLNLMGIYSYAITKKFSVSAEAGVSAARLYRSFGKVVAPNTRIGLNYDVDSNKQFEKLNYGAIIGINPSLNLQNVSIQTSIRYRHGLNNINSFDYTTNRYLANPERTIQTRDILFEVGFLIPIYKKEKLKESVIGNR